MATKKELFENVTSAVTKLCEEANVSKKVQAGLTAIFEEHLAPKSGGQSVNLDEVTRKDADGNITEILCSVSDVWLPATEEFFYLDKSGKGITDAGLKRVSKQGEATRKRFLKEQNASEKAIVADFMSGAITPDESKKLLEELKTKKPDYSGVTATPVKEEDAA